MKIDHFAVWTSDLEKVKEFYLKYFNCKSNSIYINPKKGFSSYFLTFFDGARIELMKRADITEKNENNRIGYAHLAVNVGTREKVDNLTKTIEADGYFIESKPRTTGDGYYESVILDPENNRIELCAIDDIRISKAKIEDLEQILYLQKCCYLSEAEIYNNYTIAPLTQKIGDIRKDFDTQTILKLEYQNKIIGSVRGFTRDGTCYIGKLIVDRNFQNMGFGKQLVNEIEKEFRDAVRFEIFTGFNSTRNLLIYYKQGYTVFKEKADNGIKLVYLEKFAN